MLVLDAVPVQDHWPLGIFGNAFTAGVKKLELPPDMYVICACDEKQKSWASEEWQRTIFTHYVLVGLRGAAAKSLSQKITLEDLFGYVEKKVGSWVSGNRDMEQTPIFLGNRAAAKTVDLVSVSEPVAEAEPNDAPGKDFKGISSGLAQSWNKWQELKDSGAWTHAPQLWRQYQDALLRWEHLERCGTLERLGDLQELRAETSGPSRRRKG